MKKMIPILAILGSAAAILAYKAKKDERKHIVDLDQGLLKDDNLDEEMEDVEEGPISEPQSCCMEDVTDTIKDTMRDSAKTVKETLDDVKENVCEACDFDCSSLLEEEIQQLKSKALELMEKMSIEGDKHENERPVQHEVKFSSKEGADAFKNEVINKGFVITKGKEEDELVILHITPLDETKLIPTILYIASEAKKNQGTYLGWVSKVIY